MNRIVVADLDLDNQRDIIVGFAATGGQGGVLVLRGPVFAVDAPTMLSAGVQDLAVRDIDGDGYPDVVAVGSGKAFLLKNYDPGPGFVSVTPLSLGTSPSVVLADVDLNGFQDVIVAVLAAPGAELAYKNDGKGGFPAPSVAASELPSGRRSGRDGLVIGGAETPRPDSSRHRATWSVERE